MSPLLLALLSWRELPPLPRGLAGQFVGTIQGQLVVAGGTYWDGTPWAGGTKHWVNTVYTLSATDTAWRIAGTLPEPVAYGAAVSVPGAMLLIGGQSDHETHGKVSRLTLSGDGPTVEALPSLPCRCGWMTGALLRNSVYVASGGEGFPAPTKALHRFWKLDLSNLKRGWTELGPWPGPATFLAVMAAAEGSLYLAGGADLASDKRAFLKHAYRFTPASGWKRIADLPTPLQAGYAAAAPRFVVFGGNDGEWANRESDPAHPGFRREVFTYDAARDRWTDGGRMPVSLVTSGLALWNGRMVIAGGEDRPGSRSAQVIAASIGTR